MQLEYLEDGAGNRMPDFSYCGYKASEVGIPLIEARIQLEPESGDATARIQQAIDYVSSLKPDQNGFRGAVQLGSGFFSIEGHLRLHTSGVVLRGSGMGLGGTVLEATGKGRRTLIQVHGEDRSENGFSSAITDGYVPVNSVRIQVADGSGFKVGQSVIVHRPSGEEWIDDLNMSSFGGKETSYIGWKPGQRDIRWERSLVAVDENTLVLDVPLTTAIDQKMGGGTVTVYRNDGRIAQLGVENMELRSAYESSNLKDEEHSFNAIDMLYAQDVWVRRIRFQHFAGSAVAVYESSRRVTVEDCMSKAPVSEVGNWRRFTFFTMGQQTLFQRLYSEYGYHDFAVGFCAPGPNAFVECEAYLPHSFSGTIDSWASGVLFDVVNVDGGALSFSNRLLDHQGAGWTAAHSVFWQCAASKMINYSPPGALNWAVGCWGQFMGNGEWEAQNSHVKPRSLFYAQLAERLGKPSDYFDSELRSVPGFASTSPTLEQATELTNSANEPHLSLEHWISARVKEQPLPIKAGPRVRGRHLKAFEADSLVPSAATFAVKGGWLTADGKLIGGNRHTVPWWRGVARPYETDKAQPAITRFVPGRYGKGYTDDLSEVLHWMKTYDISVLEHNYGLWYERRRDDHQRTRRSDADVWAPFYEQPFARSGEGMAWDGLSKYDLTQFNSFYWSRLNAFAGLAAVEGKLLFHHHFFQHNILEAGAHWADSPWRPANNLSQTDFPEPVNYAGDKRIFMAEQFYDIKHLKHRELYRNYIRQCLAAFDTELPVMHLISAEYTGPLHFVEFWLDVIKEWEEETGRAVWIVLSTTRDVQDAILNQAHRAALIDVVDVRYWARKADGTYYAPEGGKHLSPRQHARIAQTGKRNFESVYQSVVEYRLRFPEKAVVYSEGRYDQFGWAVLFGGGSLPVLPKDLPEGFLEALDGFCPAMEYHQVDELYGLKKKEGEVLFYTVSGNLPQMKVSKKASYRVLYIDPHSGNIIRQQEVHSNGQFLDVPPADGACVVWVFPRRV